MIKNVEILPDKLKILFSNKEEIFLNIWLRDHAQDEIAGIREVIKEKYLQQN